MPPDTNSSLSQILRDIVREEIRRTGAGERRFEESVGLRRWALRGFLDPERNQSPSLDRAQKIATALGMELRLVPKGQPGGFAEPDRPGGDHGKPEALRAGFLPVPFLPEAGQSGPGPVAFARRWLEESGLDPARLALTLAAESDFASRCPVGALVLIDREAPRGGGPALWCVRTPAGARLCELEWLEDDMILVSGGDTAPRRLLRGRERGALAPLGRAVWIGFRA